MSGTVEYVEDEDDDGKKMHIVITIDKEDMAELVKGEQLCWFEIDNNDERNLIKGIRTYVRVIPTDEDLSHKWKEVEENIKRGHDLLMKEYEELKKKKEEERKSHKKRTKVDI